MMPTRVYRGQPGGRGAAFGEAPIIVDLLLNILSNIIANIVFWLGLGIAFAVVLRVGQRRLRKFFGIQDGRALHVCLSNLYDPDSMHPPPSSGARYYVGLNELEASRAVDTLFSTASFRLPDIARGLVDSIWANNAKNAIMSVCPDVGRDGAQYEGLGQPLIVIGGSRWNSVRRHFLAADIPIMRGATELTPARREPDDPFNIEITRGPQRGDFSSDTHALSMLERRKTSDATVFFCTGVRGDVTRATVEYLVRHWRALHKEFGEKNFALCLGFTLPIDGRLTNYAEPVRLKTAAD